MTRVKVKVKVNVKVKAPPRFLHVPQSPRHRSTSVIEEDDDVEEEDRGEETINTKKKNRSLSTAASKQSYNGADYYSDSAQGTSSSEEEGGGGEKMKRNDRFASSAAHRDISYDEWDEITGVQSHQRSRIRLKVKPYKQNSNLDDNDDSDDNSIACRSRNDDLSGCMSHSKKRNCIETPPYCDGRSKEQKINPYQRCEVDIEELRTALMVVTKIMRMEAAEPFNFPVDPVALGIPDYFHVVKKPMDLGTICKNLERGAKYRNSRDVYEDVQLVWDNCRSYNQKGDPILDLLVRVKKNFTKYWTAAGLSTERNSEHDEEEHSELERVLTAKHMNNSKSFVKENGSLSALGKHRRAAGTGHHKADCACVVCVGVRRKLAREVKRGNLGTSPEAACYSQERIVKSEPNLDGPVTSEERKLENLQTKVDRTSGSVVPNGTSYMSSAKEEVFSDQHMGNELVKNFNMEYAQDEDIEGIKDICENDGNLANEQLYRVESSEEGVRYYQASYEMPLRTIHPSIFHLSQRLFGSSSFQNTVCHIDLHASKRSLDNPILKTVSVLLRTKSGRC